MRLLVAEDDFASRRMMQKMLADYGEVDVVVDGGEAVEAFRLAWAESRPYDVLFMDIMMPTMDGQEAIRIIRENERRAGVKHRDEVAIIMTTVLEDPRNVVKAYYDGAATSYLVKPIDRARLADELAKLGMEPERA